MVLQVFFYSLEESFFRAEGRLSYFAIINMYDDEKTDFSFLGGADGAGRFLQQRCNFRERGLRSRRSHGARGVQRRLQARGDCRR